MLLVGGFFLLDALSDAQPSSDAPIEVRAGDTNPPVATSTNRATPGRILPASTPESRQIEAVSTLETARPSAARVSSPLTRPENPRPTSNLTNVPSGTRPTPFPRLSETESRQLEQEIEQAYLRFNYVLAEAELNLNTSQLPDVLAEPALGRYIRLIEEWQSEGRALKVEIEHNYRVGAHSSTEATVVDRYTNRSYWVDPQTKQPLNPDQLGSEQVSMSAYTMRKIDGTWKVIDVERIEN